MAQTSIEHLAAKRERLAELLREKLSQPRQRPMSSEQKRFWALHQLEPGGAGYNNPYSLRLSGILDKPALQKSLTEIVRRHESLRTTFPIHDGQPVQEIHPARPLQLPVIDLAGLPKQSREIAAQQLRQEESDRPFDLARGPLLRVLLLRLGKHDHDLVLTLHHIVSDGWSENILTEELEALYAAYLDGRPSPLPEPIIQYADYAAWQEQFLRSEEVERQVQYWREQLHELPVLELQTGPVTPNVSVKDERFCPFRLSSQLRARLEQWGKAESATLFMVLLAAYEWILSRYSQQEDIAVGTVVANRNREETAGVIGTFVNTIVLRTDVSGSPSFRELVRRTREVTLAGFEHQDVPYEKVVQDLFPGSAAERAPLFQAMFFLQNLPAEIPQLPGLQVSGGLDLKVAIPILNLALELKLGEEGDLQGTIMFRPDQFARETMARLVSHFELLLEKAMASPDLPLTSLSILADEESELILGDLNRTRRQFTGAMCIHELFEEQARKTPEKIAMVHRGRRVTYRELDRRANQLANFLIAAGIRAEARVGICTERNTDMLVAILGVLKSGAAYVPFDPAYPEERIRFMLQDSGIEILLSQANLQPRLPKHDSRQIFLDSEWNAMAEHSDESPQVRTSPAHAAYVIYTSGSTGLPKGTAIEHHSAATFIHWAREEFRAEELAGVLASTSICFDLSVFEILVPLCCGGAVILAENALELVQIAEAGDVRLINTVPSAMAELLRLKAIPEGVLTINLAGEALKRSLVQAIYQQTRVQSIRNLYGPTEDTTYSTCALLERDDTSVVSIGRPIANTQAYVLDQDLQPIPFGFYGELYLGGDGLARGYLSRPEMTALRFLPDPFSGRSGDRLYRTGDRVRWLPSGELEFTGRFDDQIKIRGYRIEPGEVANLLASESGVREAIVTVGTGPNHDKRIVAYVVPADVRVSPAGLRKSLQTKLPEYMLPSVIVLLEKLPLNANGKVDRKALPPPEDAVFSTEMEHVPPRTNLESRLCTMCAEILGLPRFGIDQNFFENGGHSLLATRAISQVRSALGVEVPLRLLFDCPTIAAFAPRVEELLRLGQFAARKIQPGKRDGDLPLSYAQKRLWFIHQLQRDGVAYNAPFNFRLIGPLDIDTLKCCLSEILRRHEVLRTTFPQRNGEPVQVVHPARAITLPVIDLRAINAAVREQFARDLRQAEAEQPFDLDRGPLFRARLVRTGKEEHELLLAMHHIVSDGWSREILAAELLALWGAFREGRSSPLKELPIQYADYAIWQQAPMAEEIIQRQMSYWREHLANVPVLDLPLDHARPSGTIHPGEELQFQLSHELCRKLTIWAEREGATVFMVLLAAFQWLLGRYSGQDDVAIGTAIANRNCSEIEDLIGFFVNTLVLRSDLSGAPTFTELVQRVRETTLRGYAHQDVPFERLVEELNPDRDLQRSPLFQARFAMETESNVLMESAGLRVEEIDVQLPQVKFDLTMVAEMRADGTIHGCLVYAADLFERTRMERLIRHYECLLEEAMAHPRRPLTLLSLMSDKEREQVLLEWNPGDQQPVQAGCIHELFEEQARARAGAAAVSCEASTLTYAELNARANQLARHLQTMGVGPEIRVGIFLDRSIEMVVALLAVLKAGGAYIPLDTSSPADRVGFILEDAEAPILVTTQNLRDSLPVQWVQIVCLDSDWARITDESTDDLAPAASPENLAYILYTSGSTGKPKAAGIEHRQLVSYTRAAAEQMQCSPGWQYALLSTFSADLGNTVLFASLCMGGHLHVISEERARDGRQLGAYFREHKIDCTKITPSHLQSLQSLQNGADILPARLLVLGGEASLWKWIRELQTLRPGCRIMNHYGPTECTVGAVARNIDLMEEQGSPNVPLGRPLAHARVYVLDEEMAPVPIGISGELYIGGSGVGRCYLKRESLTAEKFLPDPFGPAGARMYKTGDKARWLSDGTLEFQGRIDQQVKIRGFRVELGEIEAVLKQHPDVRQAAVLLNGEPDGTRKLMAYVSVHGDQAVQETGPLFLLPNGLTIAHQNRIETEYLYREIFESLVYLHSGIELQEDACVVDAGANIGMFTLFAAERCPRGRILSFEPVASLFEKVRYNAALFATEIKVFNLGLSDTERTSEFTFYPRYSMMSGLSSYSDTDIEIGVIKRTLENRTRLGDKEAETLLQHANEILPEKFVREPQVCALRRLSDVLREEKVEYVDLLKIDVQRAELDVLRGIDTCDWSRIGQIVMEAHDGWSPQTEGRLREIVKILEGHGFSVTAHQYGELEGTDRWNIYARNQDTLARRVSPSSSAGIHERKSRKPSIRPGELRDYLQQHLPEYMVPAAIVLLPGLPLTANGKLDRQALPAEVQDAGDTREYAGPRNEMEEKLCAIWDEVLHAGRIGIKDNFFELGGHSLLATQVVARIQSSLGVEIALTAIFRSPTVASLAEEIERTRNENSEVDSLQMIAQSRQAYRAALN
jgi:amino acid adenylation domain-containing protein/FkbM family methyltransferase